MAAPCVFPPLESTEAPISINWYNLSNDVFQDEFADRQQNCTTGLQVNYIINYIHMQEIVNFIHKLHPLSLNQPGILVTDCSLMPNPLPRD